MSRGRPRWVDWMFRNRQTGRITIVSLPNIPLWIYILVRVGGLFVHADAALSTVLGSVATGALAIWGLDEIASGVNPFRRVLGAVIALAQVASVLHSCC